MPTRNISLTAEQDKFVAAMVESGQFQNASEAVRAALRLLKRDHDEHEARVAALRAEIQIGLDDLANGRYVDVAEDELDDFISNLTLDVPERH